MEILKTGEIKKIYEKLSDVLSKEIFMNRLMYSLSSSYEYIVKLTSLTDEGKQLNSLFQSFLSGGLHDGKKTRFVLYGAGEWGASIQKTFPDVQWGCFCDRKASPEFAVYRGLPVISPEFLANDYLDAVVVVATIKYHEEIVSELRGMGFSENRIVNIGAIVQCMYGKQYFDLDELPRSENEVFVDGGCLDGESFLAFHKWSGGKYEAIHAFEPDGISLEKCLNAAKINEKKIHIHNKGLWNENTVLHFSAGLGGSSRIATGGDVTVNVVSLDQYLQESIPTFIKLDIEGAELEALRGASRIISTYKPKIAVCLYHKKNDIWDIPSYLLELRPDYRFYIRHYSIGAGETVLYAI